MGNKYHARRYMIGDEMFDSKKEAGRWQELKLLERAGEISHLQRQVKYVLIPSQYEVVGFTKNGKEKRHLVERECSYVADFVYHDLASNEVVVEDVKGFKTKDYIIKRKLMLHVHGIRIREV